MHKHPLSRLAPWALAFAAVCSAASLSGCASRAAAAPDAGSALQRVQHVVVIFAENHSFDNLYGLFPGADGLANATAEQTTQLDHDGTPLKELIVFGPDGQPDPRFPRMPNQPFRIDAPPVSRSIDQIVPSPIHAFFHNREQINGGRNNMFAAMSQVGGWTMGHYDGSQFKLWQWAREYTLADHFFMGAYGGSYLNHQYLVCACAPRFDNAPEAMRVRLDADGRLAKKPGSPSANVGAVQLFSAGGGQVAPDGMSVNTTQPPYQPSGVSPADGGPLDLADPMGRPGMGQPLPPQRARTIGDTLSAKGVSWAWYAGGWNLALSDGRQPASTKRTIIYAGGEASPMFQPHHQPFNYHARFAPGTPDRAQHLKDGDDFLRDVAAGTLPAVAFFKPAGRYTQHPSYTDVKSGDEYMADLLAKLRASPQWQDMLIVLTYDENGGYWDHVPPPSGPGWSDRLGPGTRVPALLIGAQIKRGFVDHATYDTASILKFVTRRFGLEPLPGVREKTGDLSAALQP
ncbi:acid phosphatase [Piscinibacter sp.]|jgi:acid phosphatase|uniref:acid phosphatase n=1 Tax=Piscinibacter sp. TaxID=1903157 RepID=UPI00355953EB